MTVHDAHLPRVRRPDDVPVPRSPALPAARVRREPVATLYRLSPKGVAASWTYGVVCGCPDDLPPDPKVLARARADAEKAGTKVTVEADPVQAVAGAKVIYTDTWGSMGQEDEAKALIARLEPYRVTPDLMNAAADDAVFMHCLPAHRGEEVTADVIDGPRSLVFDEAENRLHAQKALMLLLMGGAPWN